MNCGVLVDALGSNVVMLVCNFSNIAEEICRTMCC